MLKQMIMILFLFVFAGMAHAQQSTVKLLDLSQMVAGEYVLTITEDGAVSIIPCTILKPDGPNPTPPGKLTERAKEIRDKAELMNDHEMTKKLSILYQEVSKHIRSGKFKDQQQMALFLRQAHQMVLDKDLKKWKPVTDTLAGQWAKLIQDGGSNSEYAKLLVEASAGLEAATDPARELNPVWITLIMKIIEMLFEMLNSQKGVFAPQQ